MAKTRTSHTRSHTDLNSWNFVIFLTLAFMLLVAVVGAITKGNTDITARAGSTISTCKIPSSCVSKSAICQKGTIIETADSFNTSGCSTNFRCVPSGWTCN